MALSISPAAASLIPGSTWEYVSSVMEMFLCPRNSCTHFGRTPLERSTVAHVYRRSCIRTVSGSPALLRIFLKLRAERFLLTWLGKTRACYELRWRER